MSNDKWEGTTFLKEVNALATKTMENVTRQTLEKSIIDKGDKSVTKDPRSFFVNPYDYTSSMGMWKEKRSGVNWDTLRTIVEKNPIVSAIVNTRINQVSSFSSPARMQDAVGNDGLGYKIVHKDKNKKLSASEEQTVIELEDYIWYSGIPDTYNIYDRDNFDSWLRKTVRDTLTFDAAVTELVPTRRGMIAEYHAIDPATIRLAITKQDISSAEERAFVQVLNGQIVTEFEAREVMYGIRNPTTSMRNNGYGVSEIEQLISTVTNIFNAMSHNAMFFRNGAAVKGLINIKPSSKGGGAPANQLDSFKRAWGTMVNGTQNAWKTPILQSEGVEFVNMGSTNREMEFSNYLDFLVKLTCAVFSIDPGEINFYMQSGGGNSIFESNQENKLKTSKDKGLRPLLSAISRWINQFIIHRIAPDFYFSFTGIDSKDEKEIIELRKEEVGAYKTVDEVREEAGLKPLGEEKGGDLILNPQYMQFKQQAAMEKMQAGQGGDEENPDEDPEDGTETPDPGQEEEDDSQESPDTPKKPRKAKDTELDDQIEKSLSMPSRTKFIKITLDD